MTCFDAGTKLHASAVAARKERCDPQLELTSAEGEKVGLYAYMSDPHVYSNSQRVDYRNDLGVFVDVSKNKEKHGDKKHRNVDID